jgi:hypothetical protein
MKAVSVKIFLLVFFISLNNIHADEITDDEIEAPAVQITDGEIEAPADEITDGEIEAPAVEITDGNIEAYLRGEYNRAFNYYGDISAIGSIELNNMFTFRLGFSLGKAADNTTINTHASAGIAPFSRIPLYFHLIYIYNGIPDYSNHAHAILPLVSYNTARAGISIGPSLRLTSFFDESAVFEPILSFSMYFNFINNDRLCIGINFANFNDFQTKNFGAYSLKLNVLITLDEKWQIINELELSQSGGDGFSTIFYGFGWRGGVKYTW